MTLAADGRQLPIVSVSLWLEGASFDPSVITDRVGIEPTISYRTGDPASLGRTRRRDAWAVRVGPRESLELEPMAKELIGLLASRATQIRDVCIELGLGLCISCPIEPKSTLTPSIHLSPDTLGWIVRLGASLDIDVMVWGDEDNTSR